MRYYDCPGLRQILYAALLPLSATHTDILASSDGMVFQDKIYSLQYMLKWVPTQTCKHMFIAAL